MPTETIAYQKTGYFSPLICDYLEQKEPLQKFYNRFPSLTNFEAQIEEKERNYPSKNRTVLYTSLKKQYEHTIKSELTALHLEVLAKEETFTITTGHQLNLFTGPLYFLYKIIDAILLSRKLKQQYPHRHFVPIYWMATEDHDFDEINYFNFKGLKVQWNRSASGPVGRLATKGLDSVYKQFCEQMGTTPNATALCDLFEKAYLEHRDLAAATRYLANALFGAYGLVIVDGDDPALKSLFEPYAKRELLEQIAHREVSSQTEKLKQLGYPEQVHPRALNLFYIKDGLRERLIEREGTFFVNETDIQFSKDALLDELKNHPERFSPNALLRPLYQEVILPNLCYIGGGGEIAYWFQLKSYFEEVHIPFPILRLRNSALLRTEKQLKKASKLSVSLPQFFLKQNELINQKVRAISNIEIDFTPQKHFISEQFRALHLIAEQTDASFKGAVKAQEAKQLKGLNQLEKRLLKAQKNKLKDQVQRLVDLQNELFPSHTLQERSTNFSQFYLDYGETLIPTIMDSLDPLGSEFTVITL